jgi:hypothetical protein
MATLLSNLMEAQQQELLADLNYLNSIEIQSFCKKHRICHRLRNWCKAHHRSNPEWAFPTDLADKTAGKNWKKFRAQKAKNVLAILDKIPKKNHIEETV